MSLTPVAQIVHAASRRWRLDGSTCERDSWASWRICKIPNQPRGKRCRAMKKSRHTQENAATPGRGEFETFYNDHYRAVSRYVARRLPPDSFDAVVAARFVVAWRKFAAVPNPSLAWLYRIASFEVARERELLGRQAQTAELHDLDSINTAPLEDVLDVSTAFSQLSESDAELLRLVYWENLSRNEIADALGLSVNAVNVRYHRALERVSGAVSRLAHTAHAEQPTNLNPKETP